MQQLSPKARIIAFAFAAIMLETFIGLVAFECFPKKDNWIGWLLTIAIAGTIITAWQQFADTRKDPQNFQS